MKKSLCIILIASFACMHAFAQNVGIGTTNPDASASLEVQSTSKGVLLPRLTSSERLSIASPAAGLLVYDTEKRTIYMYDGQNWLAFAFANSTQGLQPTIRTTTGTTTLGYRTAIDSAGIVVSTSDGQVFFFKSDGGNYTVVTEIISTAADPVAEKFGADVAIDGNFIAVGAPGTASDSGKVYIFERTAGSWVQRQIIKNINFAVIGNGFGFSVAMSYGKMVVGAPFNDPFTSADEGSFHTFTRVGNTYAANSSVIQPGGSGFAAGDYFGWDVAIHGAHVMVGAPGHSSKEGKVYYYRLSGGAPILDFQHEYSTVARPDAFYGYSVAIDSSAAIIGYPGLNNNAGGYHIVGNFRLPEYGDEALEFEQYYVNAVFGGVANNNSFTGASVAIDNANFMLGTPTKLHPLFSASTNFSKKSATEVYNYEKLPSFTLVFSKIETWESPSTALKGMGISTSLWDGRACAGHDEANKFLIKDVR